MKSYDKDEIVLWSILGTLALAVVGLIIYAVIAMNSWEDKCSDAEGEVVSEYTGYTDQNGVDYYNYYCMVGDEEIEIK